MKSLLAFLLALLASPAMGQTLARTYTATSDRAATPSLFSFYNPVDGKTYVLNGDPATFSVPVSGSFTILPAAAKFQRNGTLTDTALYTTTPANNRGLPVTLLAGDSLAPVAVGAGNTTSGTLRFRLVDDQTLNVALPSGASTSALQTAGNDTLDSLLTLSGTMDLRLSGIVNNTGNTSSSVDSIDTKTPALGQALSSASVPVVLPASQITTLTPQTNALTDAQLRASAVPVSVSGGATSANQATEIASLASIDGKTATLVSGRVPVDGSSVTQPVSAASLPLPSGAATSALQTSGNASLTSIDAKLGSGTPGVPSASAVPAVQFSDLAASGSLTALNQAVTMNVNGQSTFSVQLTGPFTGTVTFEATLDGTNWIAVTAAAVGTGTLASTASAVGLYRGNIASSAQFRVRCSAFTSGTIVVSARTGSSLNNVFMASALPTGANAIGTVSLNAALPTGANVIGAVTSGGRAAVQLVSATQRPYFQNFATLNLTTTYTQIIASTPGAINFLTGSNNSGTAIYIATGAAASEVIQYIALPGESYKIPLLIAAATRVAIRTESGTLTTGQFSLNAF